MSLISSNLKISSDLAYQIDIPYPVVRLNFFNNRIVVPLTEHTVIRIDQSENRLAKAFQKAFQKTRLDKGIYSAILDNFNAGTYTKSQVSIEFVGAKDGYSYPDFELTFDCFYEETEKGFWAVVPALGLESFTEKFDDLNKTITAAIKLEFVRKRRLNMVQQIISAIWYDVMEIETPEIALKFHTPSELSTLNEKRQEEILPKVAEQIYINQPVTFGRKTELEQLARAVRGKFNKSVVLVGASGVGKTALVWELVRQKKRFGITAKFFETTASTLIKELTQATGWQDNLVYLCRELSKKGDVLFIRNLLELFEVGQYEGNSVSMAEYMRSFVSRGEIILISECTDEEYARIELNSPNFLSMFQIIRLEEPRDNLEDIIVKKINFIAESEQTQIEQEAIRETIRLNRRYTPYSGFPGKPIRFLESILLNQKQTQQKNQMEGHASTTAIHLNRSVVIQHFCEETGMPTFMVDPSVPMDLLKIKRFFHDNVFGQDKAVDAVVDLLASVKTALTREGKPIASFLFVGPTGVGKTEMAKVLADFMFGSRNRMIRFDMSEYSNPYSVTRLTGVSYFEDGLLTSAVRREPFCVLLFDEIEKADPTFYDLLLQMLGEGRLTDSSGKLVNFCSTIIIMTSNIGAANLQNNRVGWRRDLDIESVTNHFMSAVRKHFRPELFNRIDKVIPFEPLTKEVIRFIVDREIALFKKREGILHRKIDFYLDDAVLDYLGEIGYDAKYGARQLQRAIRESLIIPLSHDLNSFDFDDQLVVNVTHNDGKLAIHIEADPLKLELLLEDLAQTDYADHTSDLRRHIFQLMEGRFFVRLLSELDMMERKKKRNERKFWKNEKNAENYAYYLATKQNVEDMAQLIEEFEIEFALMCMDMKPYHTNLIEDVKIWENDYFNLKVELFNRLTPQSNFCYFGFYGQHLDRLVTIYFNLFEEKGFKINAHTVWYRERYYKEEITIKQEVYDEASEKTKMVHHTVPRAKYIKNPFNRYLPNAYRPTQSGDKLVGIEIILNGTCPFLYLEDEVGLHTWKQNVKNLQYWVICQAEAYRTPVEIHRKSFWDNKKSRRTITDDHIKDSQLKLNREIPKGSHAALLQDALDQRFNKKLDKALI